MNGLILMLWHLHHCNHYFKLQLYGVPFFRCFSRDSVEGILAALEAEGSDWGNKYLEVRLANSLLYSCSNYYVFCKVFNCAYSTIVGNTSVKQFVDHMYLNLILYSVILFLFMFTYDTFRFLVKR